MQILQTQISFQNKNAFKEDPYVSYTTLELKKISNNPTTTALFTGQVTANKGNTQVEIMLIDHAKRLFITGMIFLKLDFLNEKPLRVTKIVLNTSKPEKDDVFIETIYQLSTILKIRNKNTIIANHSQVFFDNQLKKLIKYKGE